MRILLDHCVDWRLGRGLPMHSVNSAQVLGWDSLKNGKHLAAAAQQFDAVLTVDQNIKHEQNLNELPIAVLVLIAPSNRTGDLLPLLPAVERVLSTLKSGTLVEIGAVAGITIVAPGRA